MKEWYCELQSFLVEQQSIELEDRHKERELSVGVGKRRSNTQALVINER